MSEFQHKLDDELQKAITDELAWTPSVNSSRINVEVSAGAVTLSGDVASYPQKQHAVEAALRVRGVTALADELIVHHLGEPVSDTDIAHAAAAALDHTVTLPLGSVKATVHDHAITLTGAVSWNYQREAARKAVASLTGVRAVHNNIGIAPLANVNPADAKSGITSALVRHAHRDAQRIQVNVVGSTVVLSGAVSSWVERRQAAHAAWSTPGVTEVDNRITVAS